MSQAANVLRVILVATALAVAPAALGDPLRLAQSDTRDAPSSGGGGRAPSSLAALSSNTAPGTWAAWPQGNLPAAHDNPAGQDPVISNGYRAIWIPSARKFYYWGHGHTGSQSRFLVLDEANDAWSSNDTDVPYHTNLAHQFSGFTGNRATGDLYLISGDGGGNRFYTRPFGATSWTNKEFAPDGNHGQVPGSAFHPNMGARGSVVWGSIYGLERYDVATDRFVELVTWSGGTYPGNNTIVNDQTIAFWDQRANAVFIGGGSSLRLIKVATSGKVTQVGEFPIMPAPFVGTSAENKPFVTDSYTSTCTACGTDGRVRRPMLIKPGVSMRTYDSGGDSWTEIGTTPPAWVSSNQSGFHAEVPDYDGIVWWVQNDASNTGDAKAWFYRHATADEN